MAQMSDPSLSNNSGRELTLITRLVGVLAVLTGLVYLRVVGTESLAALRADERELAPAVLFVLLLLATGGLLAAWWQQAAGGAVAALSALGVAVLAYLSFADNRLFAAFAYSSPFLITGLMFLGCWWRQRSLR